MLPDGHMPTLAASNSRWLDVHLLHLPHGLFLSLSFFLSFQIPFNPSWCFTVFSRCFPFMPSRLSGERRKQVCEIPEANSASRDRGT